MKYSLAKYILSITIPASVAASFGTQSISVGGSGSYTEYINVEHAEDAWSVVGDTTGSYVFNRNDNRTGTVQVSLNQMSDRVRQFISLCNIYQSSQEIDEGLTLEIRSTDGNTVATCSDCMPKKIPQQAFGATAANQTWEFVCGRIDVK